MTEKELYIKRIFEQYKENKEYLKTMNIDGLRGVDYTKIRVSGTRANGMENHIVAMLEQKMAIEKQISLVDKIIDYITENKDGAMAKFLELRFKKGQYVWQSAQQIGISERTANRWLKDVCTIGAVVADCFNLW